MNVCTHDTTLLVLSETKEHTLTIKTKLKVTLLKYRSSRLYSNMFGMELLRKVLESNQFTSL